MTKEKLYQKVQALFSSTLGVGDVVAIIDKNHSLDWEYKYCFDDKFALMLFSIKDNQHYYYDLKVKGKLKLLRKNITLSMVLEIIEPNHNELHIEIARKTTEFNQIILVVFDCEGNYLFTWILGKSLYDQSEELIKLVYEVLK